MQKLAAGFFLFEYMCIVSRPNICYDAKNCSIIVFSSILSSYYVQQFVPAGQSTNRDVFQHSTIPNILQCFIAIVHCGLNLDCNLYGKIQRNIKLIWFYNLVDWKKFKSLLLELEASGTQLRRKKVISKRDLNLMNPKGVIKNWSGYCITVLYCNRYCNEEDIAIW